ncbi:hypothetical protein EFK50_07490 [Nocardioides marmoriginsengisoli]|uniref:Uncharacterized protein n=1 Tax=Nocardioides marmoriginsengisoli TaxID=661483 RepID=A0A3N0CM30_9ACTN|nr:hypothetical protein EFK50_07490 [Nocardioides marmoriginsengisoli]
MLRTPTRQMTLLNFAVGGILLASAVLDVTLFWDLRVAHGDILLTLAKAAVGGIALGSAIEMSRRRAANARAE